MKSLALTLSLIMALGLPAARAQSGLPRTEGTVSLDFHDVDIRDVVKAIAEITGKNFIMDDRVRGKVTIISPSPVTIEEAYQAFLSALEIKNLCTVDVLSMTKVVPLRECKRQGIVTETDQDRIAGDQPVTRLVALKYISANEIRQALTPLVSATGSMVAYGPTNTLILTDSGSNIARLVRIIEKLDTQGHEATTEMIPLRNAQASDVAQKMMQIFDDERRPTARRRTSDVEAGSQIIKILADDRTNSLIVTATRQGLERVLDLLDQLDRKVEIALDRNRIHVRKLKNADSEQLAGILSSLVSGTPARKEPSQAQRSTSPASSSPAAGGEGAESDFFGGSLQTMSSSGSLVAASDRMFQGDVRVVADPSTNSLVITAGPGDYKALVPVIDQLDSRRLQVFVETLIMEVNINKALEVGLSGHGGAADSRGTVFGGANLSPVNPIAISNNPGVLGAESAFGMILGGLSSKMFSIGGVSLPVQGAAFRALQTNGVVNVLSAPNVLTTDNVEAHIMVGNEIPVLVSQGFDVNNKPINQVSRQKVGIELKVKPKIGDGDDVLLEVEQKVQEVDETLKTQAADTVTSERTAKTTIVATSGQTVVIGGLIKDKINRQVAKVPLLGDIPLLGHLFRNQIQRKEKLNLVIFLTPHVVRDPMDMTRVSVKKNEERRRFYKKEGAQEFQSLYDYDLDKGLNLAPPAKPSSTEEPKLRRRRFDYDRPLPEEVVTHEEQDYARRNPSTPASDESAFAVSRSGVPASTPDRGGNPFADVRPAASN